LKPAFWIFYFLTYVACMRKYCHHEGNKSRHFDRFMCLQPSDYEKSRFWNTMCLSICTYVYVCMYVCMHPYLPCKHPNSWADFIHIQYLRVYPFINRCPVNLNVTSTKVWAFQIGPKKTKWDFSWKQLKKLWLNFSNPKWSWMGSNFRKLNTYALGAQMRNSNFIKKGFADID
jgi:hypothetical protein